jgi:hypothetical protein
MNGVSRVLACSALAMMLAGPPKAVRRWHRYVYLGYDLEANCTDEEVGTP